MEPNKAFALHIFIIEYLLINFSRNFRFEVLGKFSVIMADPPWDIHMELPYGTMSDDEMRQLPVPDLQVDTGLLIVAKIL